MKKIENYQINLIKLHAWTCTEMTNNTVFYNACTSPINDKMIIFPQDLKNKLGLPSHISSFYDQKKPSGAYDRLWDLTVISLCSDAEYFFKDLFQRLFPGENFSFGFYQRITEVFDFLERKGLDFSGVKKDIGNLRECFQVRHIAVHNMGRIDKKFLQNVDSSLSIGEKFIVTQELYSRYYESYHALLTHTDDLLHEMMLASRQP